MRKAAIAAAAVVLVLVLAAVLVPRLVSLESLRPRIVAALEEKTGRRIGLSKLSLSLFPGLGVKVAGLSVSGDARHPEEILLSVPEGEIRLAILPLVSGRAEFSRLVLSRPRILFRRYADGTHSASDVANRLAAPERQAAAGAREKPAKVAVVLRSVAIEDATVSIRLEDAEGGETKWEISPFTLRLSGLGSARNEFGIETRVDGVVRGALSLSGVSVRERGDVSDPTVFQVAGEGEVFGQTLTFEGKMSAPSGVAEVDLGVALPKVRMEHLADVFAAPPEALRLAKPEGVAAIALKVSGNPQVMGFEAEADLTRAGWTVTENVRKFIDAPCKVVLQGHRFPEQIVISNAEIQFPPLLLIANAMFAPATGAREWAASARISSLAELAKSRGALPPKSSPTGRLTASGRGAKASAAAAEVFAAGVDLGEVGFQLPERGVDLRGLNGHVDITQKAVSFVPLTGLANGQRFTLRGNVTLGAAPAGQVELRMPYLDLDALLPREEGGKKGGDGEKKRKEKAAPAAGREVSARASLAIDAGKAKGIEFRDLAGTARYEKGTLHVESMRAMIYGGEATVTGRVLLSGPAPDFRVKVSLKDVRAEELLARKTSLGDFLSGAVTLSADLGGGSRDFAEFARTASGSGAIRVAGGKIKGVDLLSVASGLAGLQGILPQAPGGRDRAAGETAFSDLSADFSVSGGKIRSRNVSLLSDRLGLSGAALIGFDRTIDFRGALRLPKETSDRVRGKGGKFLVGPAGRVEIPLVMSGPLASPAVAVDADALARGAVGELIRGLTDRVPGSSPAPENAAVAEPGKPRNGGEPARDAEGLIRRLLRGK